MTSQLFTQYQLKAEPPPGPLFVSRFESAWHEPWTEPVRQKIKPALAVALIASGLFAPILGPAQPGPANASTWLYAWSEPVRLKPGLRSYLQRFFQNDARFLPAVNTFMSWWSPFREPVRFKPGLSVRLQHSFEAPPRWLPNPSVTARMATTEIDNDIAIFDINVYNPATTTTSLSGANVSVVEVVPGNGLTSIKEGQ